MAEDLTAQVLSALASADGPVLTSEALPNAALIPVKAAVDRLRSRGFIEAEQIDRIELHLTEEEKISQRMAATAQKCSKQFAPPWRE